ncbi:type II toxin-antitoxin system VapC family toxin [Mycolicibacter sp. MYC123]|uniref:Type II toxin-antitoxin system VapC family toxin n=1 Tax=[Mycobacterium] zoologicum TaxID=2872311 RepID=A0ABU5YKD4_9MYCO|nr:MULTISPECIES: type II toxin-antitoxin system VapC family toxin [unclassified Mycolicibacter]MEB3050494.1 type II toxin-antitoxin system VapC family toxin [Mycolicibacter sp. MYC123]MEB3064072.1 type II toxin-antitoxin system VapC family toxin [Mycolicibacter sp. MYC101]
MTRSPRGLVDTNVLILIDQIDPADLPAEILVSAITMAELAAGPHHTHDPAERASRIERLQHAEALFEPLAFGTDAARRYGHVVAAVLAAGRQERPRRIDLMIASIASVHRLPLFTVNTDDFAGLEGLVEVHPVTHPVDR